MSKSRNAGKDLKAESPRVDEIALRLDQLAATVDSLIGGFQRMDADLVSSAENLTRGFARLDANVASGFQRIDAVLRLLPVSSPEQTTANAIGSLLSAAAAAPAAPVVEAPLPHPFSNMTREQWAHGIKRWLQHAPRLLAECGTRPCPACASNENAFAFTSHDGYPFHECGDCGAWFSPLRVNSALFERYVELQPEERAASDYMLSQDADEGVIAADTSRFSAYYAELRELRGAGGALLDIGCGVGTSLDAAKAHEFDGVGVEISVAARKAAAAKGRRVVATLAEAPKGPFSVISLWESLEHMETPDDVGAFAARHLAPDGLLAITVPNLNSPVIRGMRGDSLHIHGGSGFAGHMNLFSQRALTRFLARHGFEPVRVKGQFSMNLFEVVGYNLGLWRGARDYLDTDKTTVALPERVFGLCNVIGPAVAEWEQKFAMGPILHVIARRKGA